MMWLWIVLGLVVYGVIGLFVAALHNHVYEDDLGRDACIVMLLWPMAVTLMVVFGAGEGAGKAARWLEKKLFKEE